MSESDKPLTQEEALELYREEVNKEIQEINKESDKQDLVNYD